MSLDSFIMTRNEDTESTSDKMEERRRDAPSPSTSPYAPLLLRELVDPLDMSPESMNGTTTHRNGH
jgi:hypothetical protein